MCKALYDYFENIVKPTVDEYLSGTGRCDIRRAKLAAIVLEHMIDYYDLEYSDKEITKSDKKRKEEIRIKIGQRCPSYSIVRSVADATKHRLLTRKDENIKDIEQVKCPHGLFEKPFGEGCFVQSIEVYLEKDNGDKVSVEEHIRELLKFLEENYKSISLSNVNKTLEYSRKNLNYYK